jgi:nucleotide-binding universal stress UspA family protein
MTLLVGFPPGHEDRSGLELAATFARSSGQDLLLVVVVPAAWPTPVAGHTDREFEVWSRVRGRDAVAAAEKLLAEHCPELTAEAIWVEGRSVPAALVEHAERTGASMIVVGAGHDGGYGRVVLGSTAHRLLHSSPLPVAVPTRGYRSSDNGRVVRATCAFRGDEASRRTLARTAIICRDVGAGLRVATFAVRGRTMYPPEVSASSEDSVQEVWIAQAEQMQEEALAELAEAGPLPEPTERVVASGRSWAEAVDSLSWQRDEVLVVGSSAASLMSRLFLGSNAAKILRHAPVPVVVVP